MNNIISSLFGKRTDNRRLISTSALSLSVSESEIDDVDGEESAFMDSLAQRQGNLDVGEVYDDILSGPWEEDTDDSTSLLSTAPVSKRINLRGNLRGLLAEKSAPIMMMDSFPRKLDDLSNCSSHPSWNVVLRSCRSSSRKMKGREKTWKPIVVKLEEASLKFYAQGELFLPFRVVSLLWSHDFRTPKYQDQHSLLTTTLFNNLCCSSLKHIFKNRLGGKANGLEVAKIGCTNRKVLHDFIDTVQRCIFGFPGFRPRGIQYRKDRVFVDVEDVYEGIQNGRDDEIKAVNNVHVKVKALVSGSPKYCMVLNNSLDGQALEVFFHKCVQERKLQSPLHVTFLPLDNCWFELIHYKCINHKPAPLRCEVSLIVHGSKRVELRAQIFATCIWTTTTSRADAGVSRCARNITLEFQVPFKTTVKKEPSGNGVSNTSVSKGNVHHSFTNETMLWSIHKLPLKSRKNHCAATAASKPLASLNYQFSPTTILNLDEFTKESVHMDFKIRGSNAVNIEEMTLGSRKFENVKTNYSRLFRVSIPVNVFRI